MDNWVTTECYQWQYLLGVQGLSQQWKKSLLFYQKTQTNWHRKKPNCSIDFRIWSTNVFLCWMWYQRPEIILLSIYAQTAGIFFLFGDKSCFTGKLHTDLHKQAPNIFSIHVIVKVQYESLAVNQEFWEGYCSSVSLVSITGIHIQIVSLKHTQVIV